MAKPKTLPDNSKRIEAYVDANELEAFKAICAARGLSVSAALRGYISHTVLRHQKQEEQDGKATRSTR